MLENGILPVVKEGWKLVTFPYGETIVLTMLYPSASEASRVRKAAVLAVISLVILLTLSSIMFISVLGVDFASSALFPLGKLLDTRHLQYPSAYWFFLLHCL